MYKISPIQTSTISGGCACFIPQVTIASDGIIKITPQSDTVYFEGLVLRNDGIYDVYGNLSTSPYYTYTGTAQVIATSDAYSPTYTIKL